MDSSISNTLITVLQDINIYEVDRYSALPDTTWNKTSEYNYKSKILIDKNAEYLQKKNKASKRAVIIAIIAAIAMTITACIYYKEIIKFVKEIDEKVFGLSFDTDKSEKIETVMNIDTSPYNLERIEFARSSADVYSVWSDGERRIIFQQISKVSMDLTIDNEGTNIHPEEINGYTVYCSTKKGFMNATWTDGTYAYSLILSPGFEWDDLYYLVRSLHPVENI